METVINIEIFFLVIIIYYFFIQFYQLLSSTAYISLQKLFSLLIIQSYKEKIPIKNSMHELTTTTV